MDISFLCIYSATSKITRGQKINKSPIQNMAETLNLEFRTPHSLKK